MMSAAAAAETKRRKRGRPRVGDVRLEFMIPELLYQRLLRRAAETGIAPTRVAADLLFKELIG
jgi:hypothetical protein